MEAKQIERAAAALIRHHEIVQRKKRNPFDEEDVIFVQIAMKTIADKRRVKPILIDLPHPIHGDDTDICVFVKDPASAFTARVEAEGVSGIAKVFDVSHTRSHFKNFEDRRRLAKSYDLFVADDRIVRMVPKLLGRDFLMTKRHPLPLKLDSGKIQPKIDRALRSVMMFVTGGHCITVRIGKTSMSPADIAENVQTLAESFHKNVPKGMKNVLRMSLKTSESIALPVYSSDPDPSDFAALGEAPEQDTATPRKKGKKKSSKRTEGGAGESGAGKISSSPGKQDGQRSGVGKKAASSTKSRGVTDGKDSKASSSAVKKSVHPSTDTAAEAPAEKKSSGKRKAAAAPAAQENEEVAKPKSVSTPKAKAGKGAQARKSATQASDDTLSTPQKPPTQKSPAPSPPTTRKRAKRAESAKKQTSATASPAAPTSAKKRVTKRS